MNTLKKKQTFISFWVATISLITLCSCGKSEKKDLTPDLTNTAIEKPESNMFLSGDPMSLIKGAELNSESFINESNVENYNNWARTSFSTFFKFKEKEQKKESAEEGNEASSEIKPYAPLIYRFRKTDENSFLYEANNQDDKQYMSLEFKINESKQLELIAIQRGEKRNKADILHYSLRDKGDAMSFLARIHSSDYGDGLITFVFSKNYNQQDQMEKVDSQFNYHYGPGAKVGWDQNQELQIDLCDQGDSYDSFFTKAISLWATPLKKRLAINTAKLSSFPPFSDLNNHCVYLVEDRIITNLQNRTVAASAQSFFNRTQNKIIDSSIFIWQKEWEKFLNNKPQEELDQFKLFTLVHELGHFLGLDHQFKKPSAMSYETDDLKALTPYDIDAIQTLYPLKAE